MREKLFQVIDRTMTGKEPWERTQAYSYSYCVDPLSSGLMLSYFKMHVVRHMEKCYIFFCNKVVCLDFCFFNIKYLKD